MEIYRDEIWIKTDLRREFINITSDVIRAIEKSGIS
ncbi:MAG: YjbQ family protein, partial [Methanomicrobia archaeon]|nr:YjbQ family protein [Methanomicrobia archaeon]